jgi:hypothetical protein
VSGHRDVTVVLFRLLALGEGVGSKHRHLRLIEAQPELIQRDLLAARAEALMASEVDLLDQLVDEVGLLSNRALQIADQRLQCLDVIGQGVALVLHGPAVYYAAGPVSLPIRTHSTVWAASTACPCIRVSS